MVALEMWVPDPKLVDALFGDRNRMALALLYDSLRRELEHRDLFVSGGTFGFLGFGVCMFTVTEKNAALDALRFAVNQTPAGPFSKILWLDQDELIFRKHSGPDWPCSFLSDPKSNLANTLEALILEASGVAAEYQEKLKKLGYA